MCPENNRLYVPLDPDYSRKAVVLSAKTKMIQAVAIYAVIHSREKVEIYCEVKSEIFKGWLEEVDRTGLWDVLERRVMMLKPRTISKLEFAELRDFWNSAKCDRRLSHSEGIAAQIYYRGNIKTVRRRLLRIASSKLPKRPGWRELSVNASGFVTTPL